MHGGRAERISSETHHTTHISLNLQSAEVGDEDDALLYSASEAGRFRCGNAHTTQRGDERKERDDAASGGTDGCSSAGRGK